MKLTISILIAGALLMLCAVCLFDVGCGERALTQEELAELIGLYAQPDINGFLLDKLQKHRVVMVGDSHHGSYLFSGTIINVLNAWLDSLETNGAESKVPREILLVLEHSQEDLERVKRYWKSGDVAEFVDSVGIIGDSFTTETLEFYHDLGLVVARVEAWNSTHGVADGVVLDMLGPESHHNLERLSREERWHYFVHERDELSSARVIEVLRRRSGAKALAYYGSAHLNVGYVSKDFGRNGRADSGYYLAHYLNEAGLGGGVYRVEQVAQGGQLTSSLPAPWQVSFAFDRDQVTAASPSAAEGLGLDCEGQIWYRDSSLPNKAIARTWSARLAKWAVDCMDYAESQDAEFFQGAAYMNDLYLRLLTGQPVLYQNSCAMNMMAGKLDESMGETRADASEWRLRLSESPILAVHDIVSLNIWRRMLENLRQEKEPNLTRLYAYTIAGELKCGGRQLGPEADIEELADTFDGLLTADSTKLVTENLIALLWVGDEKERAEALEILKEMNGQTHETPKQWSVWWRESGDEFIRQSDSLNSVP